MMYVVCGGEGCMYMWWSKFVLEGAPSLKQPKAADLQDNSV